MPIQPPTPADEPARLRALADYDILDTPPETAFDDLARLAALVCATPIALVSFVDASRQWSKARVGHDVPETPRALAFCAHAVAGHGLLEVPDARQDPRFADNPLVTADPPIRFYAGAPLATAGGHALGTLCVIDREPRRLTAPQRTELATLARQVMTQLELRRQNRRLQEIIAESRQTARALRVERAYLERLFESAPEAIVVLDAEDRVVRANPEFTRMFGYAHDECVGRPINALIVPPRLRDEGWSLTRQVAAGNQVATETVRHRKDGSPVHVSILGTPVALDGGQVGVYGIYRDVTERRRSEEALRASEAFARAVMDHMLEGLVIVDEANVIISVNRATEGTYGYRRDELLGQHLGMLLPGPMADMDAFLREAGRTSLGRITEWEGRRKNGEVFPFELSLFAFEAGGRRFFAGAVRDTSERREVDRLKKEFVATVSHELRTPLTSIRGALGLLGGGLLGELSDEAREVVDVAERNAVRLVTLINDILDLERLESGRIAMQVADVPLAAVLQRALEATAGVAAEGQVTIVAPDTSAWARADADRLTQVLVNLLSNAVKFSPPASVVTVAVDESPDWLEVRVTDRGRGIPRAFHETIFERFRQVTASDQRDRGGTGLGLAICKAIVDQHRGLIGVESNDGAGSTFWFCVPPAPRGGAAAESTPT